MIRSSNYRSLIDALRRYWLSALIATFLLIFVSGCALFSTPAKTVMAYLGAGNRRDYPEARRYVSERDIGLLPPLAETEKAITEEDSTDRAIYQFFSRNRTYKIESTRTTGKTSSVSFACTQPRFDSVYDAATSDGVKGKSELQILQYLNDNKALILTETWRDVVTLRREHDGWKVFLDIKGQNEKAQREAQKRAAQTKEYAGRIEFRNIEVSHYDYDDSYFVTGELKNCGTKTIKYLQARVFGLDRNGKAVFEMLETLVYEPLSPNYSKDIIFQPKDPPSDWTEEIEFEIVAVDFEQ